jgi:hypothetical protein
MQPSALTSQIFRNTCVRSRLFALIGIFIGTSLLVACASSRISTEKTDNTTQAIETITATARPSQTAVPSSTNLILPSFTTSSVLQPTAIRKTRTPTKTIRHTPEASLTSTPQPPLEPHTWEVEQVLLQVEQGGGDGCCYQTNPPSLVLYADGLFIKSRLSEDYLYEMYGRVLARQEICTLLNTLDQIGFLDYDHSIFMAPMDGAPDTNIIVNAWKSNDIGGQILETWVYRGGDWWITECPPENGCSPPPIILPALANTVILLDNYDPGGLQRIMAEKMIIWALPEDVYPIEDAKLKPWPIKEITLEEISKATKSNDFYSMVVSDEQTVKSLERYVTNGFYKEGDLQLKIFIRPLWPAETHFGISAPEIPIPSPVVPPGTKLSCVPEDGTLPLQK